MDDNPSDDATDNQNDDQGLLDKVKNAIPGELDDKLLDGAKNLMDTVSADAGKVISGDPGDAARDDDDDEDQTVAND